MITVVVGAQYGGEGKGKICAYLESTEKYDITCRCGGPNSSHTVVVSGSKIKLRMMPAAAVINRKIDVVFGAGTLIHVPTLIEEIRMLNFCGNLYIDPNAGIITDEIVAMQRGDARYHSIGSTLTGTGYASAHRAMRVLPLAKSVPDIANFLTDCTVYINNAIGKNKSVLVEGHQGFGLSNYHGDYPYCSSRDSTSAAMLSEIGVGPNHKMRIVLGVKIFPTRNHAGYLAGEIDPSEADVIGINEWGGGSWGGVPDNRRRVGILDEHLVRRAVMANSATEIALTGMDYFDRTSRGKTCISELSKDALDLIKHLSVLTGIPVSLISSGPDTAHMIDLYSRKRAIPRVRSA